MAMRVTALIPALLMVAASVVGCAARQGPTAMDVPAGAYPATFDAVRSVLREARFNLERVDANAGVISTQPKHSAGLMTPWDAEQSSAEQEIEDVLQNQRRVVRVTFEPADEGVAGEEEAFGAVTGDLLEAEQPLRMNVRVVVLRDYRPGWQVQTSSVRLSTYTYDPALGRRGMLPDYETAIDEDRALAARLVEAVAARMGSGG